MRDVVFEATLMQDGHLSCPRQYADPRAEYKVIASLPDGIASDADIESVAAADAAREPLSPDEVNYYMNLDDSE